MDIIGCDSVAYSASNPSGIPLNYKIIFQQWGNLLTASGSTLTLYYDVSIFSRDDNSKIGFSVGDSDFSFKINDARRKGIYVTAADPEDGYVTKKELSDEIEKEILEYLGTSVK